MVSQNGQKVREFILELQKQAAKCNFGDQLHVQLRDRLFAGIDKPDLERELLRMPNCSSLDARTVCSNYEAVNELDIQSMKTSNTLLSRHDELQSQGQSNSRSFNSDSYSCVNMKDLLGNIDIQIPSDCCHHNSVHMKIHHNNVINPPNLSSSLCTSDPCENANEELYHNCQNHNNSENDHVLSKLQSTSKTESLVEISTSLPVKPNPNVTLIECTEQFTFPNLITSSDQEVDPSSDMKPHLFSEVGFIGEDETIQPSDEESEPSDSSSSIAPPQELSTEISAIEECDDGDFEEADACVSAGGGVSDEINARIVKARVAYANLGDLWRLRDVSLAVKGR
ncbi:unnamed protein product [Schistosoma mattheei]|uniref:Uncharacterized protein n=1 Tax=Schistosoma mattheei TaxID=31246 RepID=A0A183PTR8_9TREM|nr:unnamed protein product [Schistosoma mattheei]